MRRLDYRLKRNVIDYLLILSAVVIFLFGIMFSLPHKARAQNHAVTLSTDVGRGL